jgi:hypothetical protein
MRHMLLLLALMIVARAASADQLYRDPKYGFEISFPDGWLVIGENSGGGSAMGVRASPAALCAATATETPATQRQTQTQIDAEMRVPFGEAVWRDEVFAGTKGAKVVRSGVRDHPSGRPVQEAVVETPFEKGVDANYATAIATQGLIYSIVCVTAAVDFDMLKPVMTAIVDSFRPGAEGSPMVNAVAAENGAPLQDGVAASVARTLNTAQKRLAR